MPRYVAKKSWVDNVRLVTRKRLVVKIPFTRELKKFEKFNDKVVKGDGKVD